MDNPITPAARGRIYVAGIVIGALGLVASAALDILGANEWAPLVTAISSASGTLTATLSRANLTNPYHSASGGVNYDFD